METLQDSPLGPGSLYLVAFQVMENARFSPQNGHIDQMVISMLSEPKSPEPMAGKPPFPERFIEIQKQKL
jgi:hypothetical protein